MKRHLYAVLAVMLCATASATAVDIADLQAGTLASRLTDAQKQDATLTVSGSINARDFETIKEEMKNLRQLDLSGATIAAYIPAKPIMNGVAGYDANVLPEMALFNCGLTELKLPAGLTRIADHALAGNSFATIALPASLTSLGDDAFYGCKALTEITLPAATETVGQFAFAGCTALKTVDFSASKLTALHQGVLKNDAAITEVKLPAALASIGDDAFAGCKALKWINLPDGLKTIGKEAFTMSGLTYATIPESVTSLGDFAFARCEDLTQANIKNASCALGKGLFFYDPKFTNLYGEALTIVPDYCFSGDAAFLVTGPNTFENTTEIGDYALLDNGSEKVTFSGSLTYLGDGAMEGMTGLKSVDVSALDTNVPALGTGVWSGVDQSAAVLTVASDSKNSWQAADQWKEFTINELTTVTPSIYDSADSTRAWFEGKTLHIASTSEIENVKVYMSDGRTAALLSPFSTMADIDTSDFSEKVYVVVVQCADKASSRVFKLMR